MAGANPSCFQVAVLLLVLLPQMHRNRPHQAKEAESFTRRQDVMWNYKEELGESWVGKRKSHTVSCDISRSVHTETKWQACLATEVLTAEWRQLDWLLQLVAFRRLAHRVKAFHSSRKRNRRQGPMYLTSIGEQNHGGGPKGLSHTISKDVKKKYMFNVCWFPHTTCHHASR